MVVDLQQPVQSVPITTKLWDILGIALCDKVCQRLAADQWFSPGTAVTFINKTDCHEIAEILLKVALSTINQPTLLYKYRANSPLSSAGLYINVCLTCQILSKIISTSILNSLIYLLFYKLFSDQKYWALAMCIVKLNFISNRKTSFWSPRMSIHV
jgi:hypothetical protein